MFHVSLFYPLMNPCAFFSAPLASQILFSVSSSIHLSRVTVPAHFKSKFRAETVRKGQDALIRCEAEGDRPLTISWTKDKNPLRTKDDLRYESTETPTKDGVVSEIIIRNAERRDSALFTCIAGNPYGEDETNIQMIMQGECNICSFYLTQTFGDTLLFHLSLIHSNNRYRLEEERFILKRAHFPSSLCFFITLSSLCP